MLHLLWSVIKFFMFVLLFTAIELSTHVSLINLLLDYSSRETSSVEEKRLLLDSGVSILELLLVQILHVSLEEFIFRAIPFAIIFYCAHSPTVAVVMCFVSSATFGLAHGISWFDLVVFGTAGLWIFAAGYWHLRQSGLAVALLASFLVHYMHNSVVVIMAVFLN